MKKFFIHIILTSVIFILFSTLTFADCEKIERRDAEGYNKTVAIDTSKLMCDTQPVYGNEMYLQVNHMVNGADIASLPDKYKDEKFSNSPVYMYDSNLDYINSIEFDGVIPGFKLIDEYFFFQQTIYGDDKYTRYYKSSDMIDWIEITCDEYMLITRRVQLINGMQYTWENNTFENDGMIYKSRKKIEYLIDGNNTYQIKRENEDYLSGRSEEATDFSVYTLTKRSMENYNDLSLITNYISLDGLSMFEVPNDANFNDIWNDNEYVYIGIAQDDTSCYRIPISYMSDCIKIKCNDKFLSFATNPMLENGRTLVPMRFLFEQIGANVDWDNDTQTATVEKGNEEISFSINNTVAMVNNIQKTMDVPARLINDKTMIPLRFLSEELGYDVEWNGDTQTIIITN